jgi:hypothetical protein
LTKNLECELVLSRNLDKNVFIAKKSRIRQGLPVRKKTFLTAGFISVLFLVAIAEAGFVKFAQANPYLYHESGPPPADVTPLAISISSPKNNTLYRVNNITFTFSIQNNDANAHFPSRDSFAIPSIHYFLEAYLKADWMEDNVTVYERARAYRPDVPLLWNFNETFWNVPDGEHSVVITALGGGGYAKDGLTWYSFQIATTAVMNFTVDATPPEVLILSPLNATYYASEIPFNFILSENPSLITYSLDGQKNSTLDGNTTLTNLPNGEHKLIVYVWDVAGNVGVSETAFNIEPFLTALVATAPGASVAIIGVGLLVYFKKRKR